MLEELSVIGLFYVAGLIVLICVISHYLNFEFRAHGWKLIKKNKFVKATLLANVCHFLNVLLFTIDFFLTKGFQADSSSVSAHESMQTIASLLVVVAICCHVFLVYLRTSAVFAETSKTLLLIRTCAVLFFICCTGAGISVIPVHILETTLSVTVFEFFAMAAGLFLGVLDLVSTWSFLMHVSRINSSLIKDSHLMQNQNHLKQTELIARRGTVICSLSILSLVFYVMYWIVQNTEGYGFQTDWLFLFFQLSLLVTMTLWMSLKIELDEFEFRKKLQHKDSEVSLYHELVESRPQSKDLTDPSQQDAGNH
jgi:hypothetical protein